MKKIFITLSVISLAIYSCRKEMPEPQSLDEVVKNGGVMPGFDNRNTIINTVSSVSSTDSGEWICTTNTYDVINGTMDYPVFDPNTSIIYPGNLLQGGSLYSGSPDIIPLKRGPGVFSINLNNGSWIVTASVNEVTKSKVSQAVNDIIDYNNGSMPANFIFNYQEVKNIDQLSLQLGGNLSYPPFANVSGTFSFATGSEYNHFIVKLVQIYYTISYDIPTSTSGFFHPSVTPAQVAKYVQAGNPATFISDVTYGRIFYMLIESTSSATQIDAAINASFQIGPINVGSANIDVNYLTQLDDLKIKVLALGGEAGTTIATIGTTNLNQLVYMIGASTDIETASPLSYVVRNMWDSKVVKNKVALEYDLTDCSIYYSDTLLGNPTFWLDASNIVPDNDGEISLSNTSQYNLNVNNSSVVSYWPDVTNPVSANAAGMNRPLFIPNAVNGYPCVEFCHIDDGNNTALETKMSYPGQRFVNTPYTLFVVEAQPSNITVKDGSQTIYSGPVTASMFLKGNSQTDNGNLQAGFTDANNFTYDHYNSGMNTGISMSPNFRVYALQYDPTKGMSVWVNGVLQAKDITKKNPLISNVGAAIGSFVKPTLSPESYSRVQIAEIQGFNKVLSPSQISTVVNALRTKYNI